MAVNIYKGNSATFIVEFVDTSGALTVPAGGTLLVTYTSGITTATESLTLAESGDFFTATWGSSVADYGPASWQVLATGQSSSAATGELRIIGAT